MKKFLLLLCLLISAKLWADNYDILVEQGLSALEEENYGQAMAYFSEAVLLEPQNSLAQSYLQLARKLKEMEEIDPQQELEEFLENRENNPEEEETVEELNPEIQEDFIYQQEQKKLARQDRPIHGLQLSFPFYYPREGDGLSASRQGQLLYGGFEIQAGYYPQWFNSIMGIGVSSERKLFFQEDNVFSLTQMHLNLLFRSFIAEEIDARFVLGTQLGVVGFSVIDEFSGESRVVEPSWQFGFFFSEPLLYHLFGGDSLKPFLFVGNITARYSESINGLDGDLGLVYQMERFEFGLSWDYNYQFIYRGEEFQDWNLRLLFGQNL